MHHPELLENAFRILERRAGVVLPPDIVEFGRCVGQSWSESDCNRALAKVRTFHFTPSACIHPPRCYYHTPPADTRTHCQSVDSDSPGISPDAFAAFCSEPLAPLGVEVLRERIDEVWGQPKVDTLKDTVAEVWMFLRLSARGRSDAPCLRVCADF